ncbi:hypothetical protein K501DRAFT_278226 [Backusella circina FSU 941]|nr:hypothetical protein K501DRAFT_278226 [Backusella circina FSU 941]
MRIKKICQIWVLNVLRNVKHRLSILWTRTAHAKKNLCVLVIRAKIFSPQRKPLLALTNVLIAVFILVSLVPSSISPKCPWELKYPGNNGNGNDDEQYNHNHGNGDEKPDKCPIDPCCPGNDIDGKNDDKVEYVQAMWPMICRIYPKEYSITLSFAIDLHLVKL